MTGQLILESELNNLAKAAKVLDGNWCTGDLVKGNSVDSADAPADPLDRGDKFCAVGALAWILDPTYLHLHSESSYNDDDGEIEWFYMNDDAYNVVNDSEEGLVLATVIAEYLVETGEIKIGDPDELDSWDEFYDNTYPSVEYYVDTVGIDEVIYNFNDNQDSQEPVVEMFRKAAERLDAPK